MAKTINCVCCGKELKKASIFNDGECKALLFTADDGFSSKGIPCCEECFNKYSSKVAFSGTRFYNKLANAYSSPRAIDNKKWMQLFDAYINEEQTQAEKVGEQEVEFDVGPFACNSQGYFLVKEQNKKEKEYSIEKNLRNLAIARGTIESFSFTKDDITKIEYEKVGMGQPNGLFSRGYSFNIYLNDEKVLTYKPCVARTLSIGSGFLFGYYNSAVKHLIADLENFKNTIGSDLPIKKRGLF